MKRISALFRSSLFQTAAIFIATLLIGTPIYEQVDDVNATRIINGAFSGTMHVTSYQIHVMISWLLVQLYQIYSGSNWYTILCYGALFFSLYAVCVCFHPYTKQNIIPRVLIVVSVAVIYIHAILQFQYVTIAGLCVIAGALLLIRYVKTKTQSTYILVPYGLIAIGAMLRPQTVYLAAVLCMPFILSNFKKYIRHCIGIIVLVLLLGTITYISYHANEQLRTTKHIYDIQLNVNSFDIYNYRFHPQIYQNAGWSKNDYDMFTTWSYEDPNVFSQSALDHITHVSLFSLPSSHYIDYVLKIFVRNIVQSGTWYLLSAYAIVVMTGIMARNHLLILLATIVALLCIFAYFAYLGRSVPPRVGVPISLYLSGICYLILQERHPNKHRRKIWIVYAGVFSILAGTIVFTYAESSWNAQRIAVFHRVLTKLPKKDKDLIFVWDSSIPVFWMSPFDNYYAMRRYAIAGVGWPQRLIPEQELFRTYGITNLYKQLPEKNNVLLLANDDYLHMYETYMKEHYHTQISYTVLYDFTKYELEPRYGYGGKLVKIYKK